MILDILLSYFLMGPNLANSYSGVVEVLQKLASESQGQAQMFQFGVSDSGAALVGLQIGSGPTPVLVVGTHHGNEYGSTAVALGVAESLSRDPLNELTVYVVPVLNVSGFNSRTRYERVSGNFSIDPNRDYPGPCATAGPFKSKARQPWPS